MNKQKWLGSMDQADEKYVREADPSAAPVVRRSKIWVFGLVAACLCCVAAVGGMVLFTPYKDKNADLSRYASSDYYDVIQEINALTYEKPKYKNNYEMLADYIPATLTGWRNYLRGEIGFAVDGDKYLGGAFNGGVMEIAPPQYEAPGFDMAAADSTEAGIGKYEEITDNQVAGVKEADRIKRSDRYIFYLDDMTLRIFSIDRENTKQVGAYELNGEEKNFYSDKWEFYLSEDCQTVILLTQNYSKTEKSRIKVTALDVSDPADISVKSTFSLTGNYISSRVTDKSLLLITEFVIDKDKLDFDDESTFVPQIDRGNGDESIPCGSIMAPETVNNMRYTVVMKFDDDTLDVEGTAAYLSYSEDVYVSTDKIFLTHVYAEKDKKDDGSVTQNSYTKISCLGYGKEDFEELGSAVVRGYVKDQYSLDEYEGILRVVTTTNATNYVEGYYSDRFNSVEVIVTATGESSASLYCIDLDTWETVAEVADFAPRHEEVQSVRFDGTAAYVCTSIEMSDPVFFFDLSDLDNITVKDTGTIEGYSTSLVNFGSGYLLGIGVGGWSSFKAEIYEETEDGVRSVCAYEMYGASYSRDYKSYYIDRQNQLFGIGLTCYGDYGYLLPDSEETGNTVLTGDRYVVLLFDGYNLIEAANVELAGAPENKRGVYIDGYMYMFGTNDFAVEKIM